VFFSAGGGKKEEKTQKKKGGGVLLRKQPRRKKGKKEQASMKGKASRSLLAEKVVGKSNEVGCSGGLGKDGKKKYLLAGEKEGAQGALNGEREKRGKNG